MSNTWSMVVLIFLLLASGCKERFEPNLPSKEQKYLIVEGFINTNGPTRITLSRSNPIGQAKTFTPELGAIVHVEGNDNSVQPLTGSGAGIYSMGRLSLNSTGQYRIRIRTRDGKEYLSRFVPVMSTPAIDSINWKEENGGVTIYANTHDSQNNTRYYKWDYDETWEINSTYRAFYRYDNGIIRPLASYDVEQYHCWKHAKSTNILLGSSAKLESDVIFLNPLLFIPYRDERIAVRYSILVRQYAVNKEEFQFMAQMKKNTESLGTIFDPQPSAIRGNITCVNDPDELVIGYINAASAVEKRIFIEASQVNAPRYKQNCNIDTIKTWEVVSKIPAALPVDAEKDMMGNIINYYVSSPTCVDCRTRGSGIKPSYW